MRVGTTVAESKDTVQYLRSRNHSDGGGGGGSPALSLSSSGATERTGTMNRSRQVLYTAGEPSDKFIVILEGTVEVRVHNFTFEKGPFYSFGVEALERKGVFTPDFTVRALTDLTFIKVLAEHSRWLYFAVVSCTVAYLVQKPVSNASLIFKIHSRHRHLDLVLTHIEYLM